MPWEVPITVGDQTYPVQFNTEAEPTQTDIDEAVAQILSGQQGQTPPAEVEDTGQGRLSSALSNVGRGALSIIPGAIGGVGYLAEPVIGPGLKEAGAGIEKDIETLLPVNPAYQDEFSQKAAGAVGQAIGMIGTGGVAGALGKGAAVARGLGAAEAAAAGTQLAGRTLLGSGFLSGAREGGQAAEQYGMEGLSAYSRALLGGAIEVLTEKIPFDLGTELAPVRKLLGDTLEKGAGGVVKAIGTEAGEESLAQVGGNVATKMLAPAGVETPGILEGAGEAAALGGVAGGVVGGIGTLLPSSQKEEEAPVSAAEAVTVESGEMPLPTVLTELEKKVTAAVDANADVLPATAAVLKEKPITPAAPDEQKPQAAVSQEPGVRQVVPESRGMPVVPEQPPAQAPEAPVEPEAAGLTPVVSQTPPTSEQQTELSVEGETQTAASKQPVSTETPIAEAPVVTGAAEEYSSPKEWANSLPKSDAEAKAAYESVQNETPYEGVFNEGELTADSYGDDPYIYRNEFVDPEIFRDILKLEGLTYEQVVQMPSTQRYIQWYKEGRQPPPIDVVIRQSDSRRYANNRRRVVAALEAGITAIPARVEIGRASEIWPGANKGNVKASPPIEVEQEAAKSEAKLPQRDATKPEQMTLEELTAFKKQESVAQAEEALRKAKTGEEVASPFVNGFKNKTALVRAREAELKAAKENAAPVDIWGVSIEAAERKVPISSDLVESLDDTDQVFAPGPGGEPGGSSPSIRKQLIENLSSKGYVREGDLYVYRPESLPSTETAPQTTTPKPQDASIQNEVEEAGGPTPVEGQPPETRPEGQAQEGAAQRSREGEEGQVTRSVPVEGKYSVYQDGGRWLVQQADKRGFGDHLFDSEEEAVTESLRQQDMARKNAEFSAKQEAAAKAAQEVEEARLKPLNDYLDALGLSAMQRGKLKTALSADTAKQSRETGKIYQGTRFNAVQEMVADGFRATTEQVPAIKEPTGIQWNRMNNQQQAEFERKRKAAGMTTQYSLTLPSGSMFVVTKAEHDYAKWLAEKSAETLLPTSEKPILSERAVRTRLEDLDPVQAAAITSYGITLPEGYVREGDLYVFAPEAPAAPAAPAPKAETEQGAGMTKPQVKDRRDSIPAEDLADYDEFMSLLERRGPAQNKVKGFTFSKADEKRFQELGKRLRKYLFETVSPATDPVIWKDINGQDIHLSAKGTLYTVQNGRVQTGVGFESEKFIKNFNPKPIPADFIEKADAVDLLPEGYVREGDLYVYRPEQAPVEPTAPEFGASNTVFTKEKAEEARKVLKRKLGQSNVPIFDPELFSAATNYAGYLIEGGVRSIADFSANMVKEFGEGIRPYIKGLYNGVRDIAEFEGMDDASKVSEVLGEATPAAPAAAPVAAPPLARSEPKQETPKVIPTGKASPAEAVDLRRSAMDEERKRLGLPPLAQPIQKAIGDDQMYDLAMQEFEKDPLVGDALVDMVNTRPRSLNSLEIAILGIEIANRRNAVDMADNAASADPKNQALQDNYQKAVARYDDAQQALPLGISDVGRALRLMRVLIEQDFSKDGLVRKFRQASGGVSPNEEQTKKLGTLSEAILDAEKKIEELRSAREENARLQETIDNMMAYMKANFVKELQAVERANKEASEAVKVASKAGKGGKSSLAIWKEKIRARRAERRKKVMADPFLFNALLDAFDDVLLGAIKIAEGVRNAAQWLTEMRDENPEFTEYTDDQLEEIRQASQAYYDSNLKGIIAEGKETEAAESDDETGVEEADEDKVFATFDDVTARDIYLMVRDRVQKGMTKVEDVMKSVTEEIQKQIPDVTERQVRDRFSGYGRPLFPSGGDIAKKVRELRTLAQYASKIEDAQRKIAPLRAGRQRDAATDAIRAAQKELYRLMKENGLEMAPGNRAVKTPLDIVKSRLRNSIADLDRQIAAKKRDAKSTKEVTRDVEAADLENQAKVLRAKLDEIDPPKQPSFQDKAKARMKSIAKEIVSLRQKLANKDITKPESEPIINEQIQVLLNERDALKQAMDELRLEIEGEPYLTQDEINERAEKILDRNIKSLETEIKELQDPNFRPQPAQKAENTPTIIRLKARQKVLRDRLAEVKEQRFGKKTKSEADLLDAAIASAEKSINDLNDRINRGEIDAKKREPSFTENAKLRNLRAERNSLRAVMFDLRRAKAEAAKDPGMEQLKRDRKYLETRTKYYEGMADKLRNGTYKPKVKEARKFNDALASELKRLDDAKMAVADILLQERLKNRSSLRKAFDFIGDLFSLQRVITATADLSAIANQGNFILFSNPRIAMKAIPDMLRAMRTEEGEKEVQERLRNTPEYQDGELKRVGMYLAMDAGPNAPLSKMEEQYATRLVAKWPKLLGGGLVRGSERAYKTLLDVIRVTSYKVLKESLVKGSIFRPPQQSTQENLESIANLINNATGRGVFKMKKADQLLSQAAPFLNTFIFAARFGISRFAMALGLPLWRASPQTRALIAEQYAKYIFGVYIAMLLLSLGQDEDDEPIKLDFRATDAGKLRYDDNRIDLLGGFQQPLVFLTRLLTGETVTAKGKLKPLREGDRPLDLFRDSPLKGAPSYGAMSGDSLIGSFLRFKLAPTTASIINALAGKDPVGNKTDIKSEIIKAPIPLQVSQLFEILGSQQDDPATAALLMGLGVTGVRTTFQGKNAEKNNTAWDNMVNKVNELLGEK